MNQLKQLKKDIEKHKNAKRAKPSLARDSCLICVAGGE